MPSKVRNGLVFLGVLVVAGGVAWFSGIRTETPRPESAADGSLMVRPPSSFNDAPISRDPSAWGTSLAEAPVTEAPLAGGPPNPTEAGGQARESARKVMAYYFHRTLRCRNCLTIEAYTQETVERDFAQALAEGYLEWRPVNIQQPGQEHFEVDFQLTTQAVVLVELRAGQMTRWKKLERVWELLDDKSAFQEYILGEVAAYVEAVVGESAAGDSVGE